MKSIYLSTKKVKGPFPKLLLFVNIGRSQYEKVFSILGKMTGEEPLFFIKRQRTHQKD